MPILERKPLVNGILKLYVGLSNAVRWRRHWVYLRLLYVCAFLYRFTLHRTVFIGVTGSVGKTTTKKLITGILETHFRRGQKAASSWNYPHYRAPLVLNTQRSDSFCIAEIALAHQFRIDLSVSLFRPTVGVVTNIGDDHIAAYGSRGAIAAEKGKLIQSLPRNGIAILNADDPLVLAM